MMYAEFYKCKSLLAATDRLLEVSGLGHVCKADGEGDPVPFESAMVELLLNEWDNVSKPAVKSAVAGLLARSGVISVSEMSDILDELSVVITTGIVDQVAGSVLEYTKDAYRLSKSSYYGSQGLVTGYDNFDEQSMKWVANDGVYWIGTYYDRHLSKSISNAVASGLEAGLGREEVGKLLKDFFNEYPGVTQKPDSYWTILSANGMNRSRNFGLIRGYEELGVTNLRIVAVIDQRTSSICRTMNGKVFPVSACVSQRNAMMNAQTPEDVKSIAPWLSSSDVSGKSVNELIAIGAILPPYHGKCRSTFVEESSNITDYVHSDNPFARLFQ